MQMKFWSYKTKAAMTAVYGVLTVVCSRDTSSFQSGHDSLGHRPSLCDRTLQPSDGPCLWAACLL